MFDLETASWAALVAQLVRASVRSAECHGFKSHLSFFLSFFLPQVIMHLPHVHVQCIHVVYSARYTTSTCISTGHIVHYCTVLYSNCCIVY